MNANLAYLIAEIALFVASGLMIKFSPENSKISNAGIGILVVLLPGCITSFAASHTNAVFSINPNYEKYSIWKYGLAGNLVGLGLIGLELYANKNKKN